MKERTPAMLVERRLHPVASELGEVDRAAQFEYLKGRNFFYQVFRNETCTVELDEEPPHAINEEALQAALQIALMLNCKIPDEIQVMRKIVIDGSNTAGFQRTAIIGLNGFLEYKNKKVEIVQISLEEDAAAIVNEEGGKITYRLNRLGVPLVEIDTGILEGYSPEEIQEIAYLIGMTCRLTGQAKRGIGSIRQDINISLTKGTRVEIKGVQELGMLAKIIENEVKRQQEAEVKEETRTVKPDGTTEFMRPLPGAERMYPETDIVPVSVNTKLLHDLKKHLPETATEKMHRLTVKLKLPQQMAKQILQSDYLPLFEKIVKENPGQAKLVANVFTSIVKDLNRQGVSIDNINDKSFVELFDRLVEGKVMKEAIPQILTFVAAHPDKNIMQAAKELKLIAMNYAELEEIIRSTVKPDMEFHKALGVVMSKVRGRADIQTVMKLLREIMKT